VRGLRAGIALLLVAAVVAGCGSGDKEPGLTNGQAQGLVAQLEAVRVAAAAGDLTGAKAALAKFRRSVAQLRQAGSLSDATARSLRIGAARVLQRVESDNAAVQETPVETQTTPTPAPPGEKKKDEKKKHHKGKGKHGEGGD
jgi:hypothetical protein